MYTWWFRQFSLGKRWAPVQCSAAGAGSGSSSGDADPYKVLGVSRGTSFDDIKKAFKRKQKLIGNDEAKQAELSRAYDTLLMGSFTQRSAGNVSVSKDILYGGDRKDYFPWRPRFAAVSDKDRLINAGIAAFMVAWSLMSTMAKLQPTVWGSVGFLFRMNAKQTELFPPPSDPEKAKAQGVRNLLRSMGLILGSSIAAILLSVTLPNGVALLLKKSLPFWMLEFQTVIINVVAAGIMWSMTSYFR
eukprot:jgi/Mesvir1/25027/Mv16967-RA.1